VIKKAEVRESLPLKPNKKLGQNFLFDKKILNNIANLCQSNDRNQRVIEIGSGYGSLTDFLRISKEDTIVYCFEKDSRLFEFLKLKFSNQNNVKIFFQDSLEVDWKDFLNKEISGIGIEGKVNIVGNLPYNISNKLIEKIINQKEVFQKIVFLVQKEVGLRWVANPKYNKKQYSYLSIFLDYFCERSLNFIIPKEFFNPIPKVDGAVVSLLLKDNCSISDKNEEKKFLKFVKHCFNFRRKTLFNNIKSLFRNELLIKLIFKRNLYKENIRPQELWLKDYLILYKEFNRCKNEKNTTYN
jgi:16S rRNA (adenine1518-N6/adenine1519-N6)-dimethyltransferase